MKTTKATTWTRRIAFYLLSLAVLAMFGWSEGAIWLVAFFGGIALAAWGLAGLDGKANVEQDDFFSSLEDAPGTIDARHINYEI